MKNYRSEVEKLITRVYDAGYNTRAWEQDYDPLGSEIVCEAIERLMVSEPTGEVEEFDDTVYNLHLGYMLGLSPKEDETPDEFEKRCIIAWEVLCERST